MDVTSSLDFNTVSPDPISVGWDYEVSQGGLLGGMKVALKAVRRDYNSNEEAKVKRGKKMNEVISVWSECRHANLVQLIGTVQFPTHVAAVYRWHEYGNLIQYLESHPRTSPCRLAARICDAVVYLHTKGIIHGNVTGEQILVSGEGIPRLLLSIATSANVANAAGIIVNTRWTAPELFSRGSKHTFASDVYALSMTILETMTRERPYASIHDDGDVWHKILQGQHPLRPEDKIPRNEVGNTMWETLRKSWSFAPAERPSAAEVGDMMHKVHQTSDSATPRVVVGKTTTVQDLVAYFERRSLSNYTRLLQTFNIAAAVPISDTKLANVYKVNLHDKPAVAVKCVKHITPYKNIKRAARELSCWSSHEHENILPVIGFAVVKGDLAMISPWMNNGCVTNYVANNPGCDRLLLCTQLARAITYLHEHQVVHGDIKGPNVLMSDTNTIQVTDFGVSIMDHQEIEFSVTSAGRGTQRWQAPEIIYGETDSSEKSDVYALGMTMIEIYTGTQPYGPENWTRSKIQKVLGGELRPPRPLMIPIDSTGNAIWQLMQCCWLGDPSHRPTSSEVYEQLSIL